MKKFKIILSETYFGNNSTKNNTDIEHPFESGKKIPNKNIIKLAKDIHRIETDHKKNYSGTESSSWDKLHPNEKNEYTRRVVHGIELIRKYNVTRTGNEEGFENAVNEYHDAIEGEKPGTSIGEGSISLEQIYHRHTLVHLIDTLDPSGKSTD